MKPSTIVELCGFACLTAAAWMWTPIAGLVTAGLCLLLVGYATEDQSAEVAVARVVAPVRARIAKVKVRRQNKRFRRTTERRRADRHRIFERRPAEIMLRVQRE